jgi:hypothetical protein
VLFNPDSVVPVVERMFPGKGANSRIHGINRFDQLVEELGIRPDRTSRDLNGLLEFVLGNQLARQP